MSHRLEALDGWRGLAALMVALYHFEASSHVRDLAFVRVFYLFVDFFFALRGFVIAELPTGSQPRPLQR